MALTSAEIVAKLNSSRSPERRSGAKAIRKLEAVEHGDLLYERYLLERKDARTWETQCEMIRALGVIDYKKAINVIEQIVSENLPHDMITAIAAGALVQLKRRSLSDAGPVLDQLRHGGLSVISGTLEVIAIDRMMPDEGAIKEILTLCRDLHKHKDRIGQEYGLLDCRQYLAIACANWNIELTRGFLEHCIETAYNISRLGRTVKNHNLVAVCENSLKGVFSKAYLA